MWPSVSANLGEDTHLCWGSGKAGEGPRVGVPLAKQVSALGSLTHMERPKEIVWGAWETLASPPKTFRSSLRAESGFVLCFMLGSFGLKEGGLDPGRWLSSDQKNIRGSVLGALEKDFSSLITGKLTTRHSQLFEALSFLLRNALWED